MTETMHILPNCAYMGHLTFKKHSMTFDALFASCFVPSTCFQLGREEITQSENRQDRQTQEVIVCVFRLSVSLLGLHDISFQHRYHDVHIHDCHIAGCAIFSILIVIFTAY